MLYEDVSETNGESGEVRLDVCEEFVGDEMAATLAGGEREGTLEVLCHWWVEAGGGGKRRRRVGGVEV